MSRKNGDSWLADDHAEDQQDERHRLGPDEHDLPARARRARRPRRRAAGGVVSAALMPAPS